MKLLGHVNPGMTTRYVDVALTDLQREFQLRRSKPRHLAPQPKTSSAPLRAGLDGLIDSLLATQQLMRCSGARSQKAIHAFASTDSSTAYPKSSPKHANSKPTELKMASDWPAI